MTLRSGAVCAPAPDGSMPGSASATESSVSDGFSIAATSASADAVAAARAFLAGIDVLHSFVFERIGSELHLAFREITLFPRLRRIERRASCHCDRYGKAQDREPRMHQLLGSSARLYCSAVAPLSAL